MTAAPHVSQLIAGASAELPCDKRLEEQACMSGLYVSVCSLHGREHLLLQTWEMRMEVSSRNAHLSGCMQTQCCHIVWDSPASPVQPKQNCPVLELQVMSVNACHASDLSAEPWKEAEYERGKLFIRTCHCNLIHIAMDLQQALQCIHYPQAKWPIQ